MSTGAQRGAPSSFGLLLEMAIILAAAVILGVVYNSVSPLGVRAPRLIVVAPNYPKDATPAPLGALPTTETDSSIQNETIQALVVPDDSGTLNASLKSLPAALTWREVKPLFDAGKVILVDGRDAQAFALGHIPGAVSLPMNQLQERIGTFSARYPKTTPLVIYCASVRCQTANAQARALTGEHGYTHVREMPGGFAEWRLSEPGAEPEVTPHP